MNHRLKLFFVLAACSMVGLFSLAASASASDINGYEIFSPYGVIGKKEVSDAFNFPCGSILTDRDGYSYRTTYIGSQCWMAENLKTRTRPDGTLLTTGSDTSERDCISGKNTRGNERDCEARGALYTLAGIYFDNDFTQDICPSGWRTPQDADFRTLEQYLTQPKRSCNPDRNSYEGSTTTGCRAILPLDDCNGSGLRLKSGGDTNFDWQLSGLRYFDEKSNTVSFMGSGQDGYLWSRDMFFNWCGWRHGNFEFGIYRKASKLSNGLVREKIFVGEPLVGHTGITAMPIRCIKK